MSIRTGSQKGDVYSVAIILQEIFYMCPPFDTASENPEGKAALKIAH